GIGSFSNSYYWCSTELTGNNAYCQLFNSGTQNNYSKSTSYFVRCARAFSPTPPPLPVQLRLDSGETPLSIFNSGMPLDSLYGKVYAGGLIFYLDQINGSGMVAAAADQAFAAKWGCYGVQIDGAGNAGIGSGQQNTLDIISGCGTVGIAAYLADTLGLEGFTDWFLPSKDELNLMYLNLQANGLGNFGGGSYWSSTEIDDNLAWLQAFNTGNEMSANKDYDDMVRSARSFGNPWVSTDSITDVSYDVATVYCNVISDGGYSVTQRGVLYGEVSLPTFSDEISSMGSGTGQFTINLSALTPNASYSARSFAINSIDTAYGRVISFLTPLQPLTVQQRLDTNETPISIFNSGVALDSLYGKIYQGGLIFYLNTVSGAGLLAATVDQSMNASWGCENTLIDGADSSGLGYGMQNTLEILAGCAELGIAAYIADTLTLNGYDDWFLPSHGELIEMYNNLMSQGLGNFSNGTYWSSTEYDATYARDVYSLNGFQNLGPKSQQRPIRCARAFGPWPVTDRDGNVYQTVEIGNQHWMQENLRTTKFSDGSPIPSGSDSATWVNLSTPGFCWYNNDSVAYSGEYGALYNWYSVETGNLCPYGWHVPAEWEWNILGKYLDNSLDTTLSGWVGSDVGGKLKEVGLAHWNSPNAGATNSVGFTALPGGYRLGDATYDMIGSYGTWWTATENTTSDAWHRFLYTNNAQVFRDVSIKPIGLSVRCVKD
ncbi:MAG: hypothetical protein KKA07_17400, partial [Bacteroidetes bacterium]|nr:hypothetical protein [Bacteroidota bacterium]